MKNIIKQYAGENSYVAIFESIQQKIEETNPESGAAIDFIDNAKNILKNSDSPLLDLTAFCTNDELVNRNDATIGDMIEFMRKESNRGDWNYILNLAKEEHIINRKMNGGDYSLIGDEVIQELGTMFNEPASVIQEAFRAGLLNSLQSTIIKDQKLVEFKNESASKRRNKLNTDFGNETWVQLNESNSFDVNKPGLFAYNPIGIGVEDQGTGNPAILMRDAFLRLSDKGIIPGTYEEYENSLVPETKNLLMALNSIPYNIESNSFSLSDNWDFNLTLRSTENGTKILELRDKMNTDNVRDLPEDKLQQFLFESVEALVESAENNQSELRTKLYNEADQFIMLNANFGRLVKLEDYVEIVNPENDNRILIHKLDDENSIPEIVNANAQGVMKFPTYEKMLVSVMEILKPNEYQAQNIMSYFENSLRKDAEIAGQYQTELSGLMTQINDVSSQITKSESLKNISNPDSQTYREEVARLKTLNSKYNDLLLKQKELQDKVAYYN